MKTIFFPLILMFASSVALAQIPQTMSIQGQLWKSNGDPLDDGTHTFTVLLFDAPTGGTPTTVCNACTATVQRGVFSLTLGEQGMPPLPPMDKRYWVSVSLGMEELTPRLPLNSVPYALSSNGAMPIGSIVAFAGPAQRIPDGWMVCDGSAQRSATMSSIYGVIGRLWGDGSDDSFRDTDFNLPDLRGIFMRGADAGTGRDALAHTRQPLSETDRDSNGVGTVQGIQNGFSDGRFAEQPVPIQTVDDRSYANQYEGFSDYIMQFIPNAAVIYIIRVR